MLPSIFFISFVPFVNLANSAIGGLLGFLLGGLGRNNSVRWCTSFALIGVFCANLLVRYTPLTELFHHDVRIFVPLFGAIGLIWGGVFVHKIDDKNWRWLILFLCIGVIAGILYQSRDIIVWLFVIGAISGAVAWFLTTARLRWVVLFAGAGISLTLIMLEAGVVREFKILFMGLGGILGALVGWYIQSHRFKWMIVHLLLGIVVGSFIEHTYSTWGIWPILIAGVGGGIVGLVIKMHRYREGISFMLLGGMGLCAIKLGWDTIQFWEAVSRMY